MKTTLLFVCMFCLSAGSTAQTYDTLWMASTDQRLADLYINGDYKILKEVNFQLLDTARMRYGARSLEATNLLYSSCDVQKFTGDYAAAEVSALECVDNYRSLLGSRSVKLAEVLNQLGFIRYRLEKMETVEALFLESEQMFKDLDMNPSGQLASLYSDFASFYQTKGLWLEAEEAHLKALKTARSTPDMPEDTYGVLLNNIGIFYSEIHLLDRSIPYMNEYIDHLKKTLPANHPTVLKTQSNLGYILMQAGKYQEARELIEYTVQTGRASYPPGDIQLAYLLRKLSSIYMRIGRYDEAILLLEEAQASYKTRFGDGHPAYSITLRELATILLRTSDQARADSVLHEAIRIMERDNRTQSIAYAQALINQGILYQKAGNLDLARSFVQKGSDLGKKLLGALNPGYYQSFGSVWIVQNLLDNRPDQALAALDSVRTIILNTYGPNHQSSLSLESQYGMAWQLKGDAQQCLEHYQAAFQGLQYHMYENFSFLTADEREQFADAYEVHRIRFHAAARTFPKDEAISAFLFDFTLFQKELLASYDRQVLSAWQQNQDSTYREYADVRSMIVRQWTKPVQDRMDLPQLEKRRAILEKSLAVQSAGTTGRRPAKWQQIQNALKPGDAVIEWLSLPPARQGFGMPCYAALVLRPGMSAPTLLLLPEITQINALFASQGARGLQYATRTYTSDALYKALWEPLENRMSGVERIVYAPTGPLHLLNFDAIRTTDGKLLSQKYNLVRVTNTARLLEAGLKNNPSSYGNALLAGGLDFESNKPGEGAYNQNLASRGEMWRGPNDAVKEWKALPNTLPEVDSLAVLLKQKNVSTTLLTGASGSETALKAHCRTHAPDILHFATHGFFFEKKSSPPGSLGLAAAENPMFRSGLILAGANPAWRGEPTGNMPDDGILTADEISLLPLQNTSLVVLSACETGLGDVDDNEGVYGLQRAFRLAGAQNIVMSLWRVPDVQTREFMEKFYAELMDKGNTREAFNNTRLAMRKVYDNPYYWAGFVLLE